MGDYTTLSPNHGVVTVIGTLPPLKGISPFCAEFALELAQDHEVEFIGFHRLYPERLYPGGTCCEDLYPVDLSHPNLHIRNVLTWFNPLNWLRAALTMRGDVIYGQWWSYPLAPLFLTLLSVARLRRRRVVIVVHNVYPHERGRIKEFFNRAVLHLGHELVVLTAKGKEELIMLGWDPARIKVMEHPQLNSNGNGHAAPGREEARAALGLAEQDRVLCFFGNIRQYKGLDDLLLALDLVRQEIPEVRLIIAGQVWEKWEDYERIIWEKDLQAHVLLKPHFLPFDELIACLRASDLAVFPFKEMYAASGSVSLALSLGCRLVVTDCLEVQESDEIRTVKSGSVAQLAQGIVEELSQNEISCIA
jgi:glycosyltransferase involved in cell wall biosynthesis